MSEGNIGASISLPLSAACGRMTQPCMISASSSDGLAHCPIYRLLSVRSELKKRRGRLWDYVIGKKNWVRWLALKMHWKHKHSTRAGVLKLEDPKPEYSKWAEAEFPSWDLLVNYVFESCACISPKCFTLLIEWIRRQWGGFQQFGEIRHNHEMLPRFENDLFSSRVHFSTCDGFVKVWRVCLRPV